MLRLTELKLPLDHAEGALEAALLKRLGIAASELIGFSVFRRGVDARKKSAIALIYTLDVEVKDEKALLKRLKGDRNVSAAPDTSYRFVTRAPAVIAAPGRDRHRPVRPVRRADAGADGLSPDHPRARQGGARAHQGHLGPVAQAVLDPESNVQFGEGGAGTFSDGKLYSQIKDPQHLGRKVLTEFVKAGAPEEILYVAKPHIGTFRLVTMVESMREQIEALGGEYRFGSRVDDLDIEDANGTRRVRGVDAGRRRAHLRPITWCSRSATARATRSRCCTRAASRSRRSRSPSACASSIRSR